MKLMLAFAVALLVPQTDEAPAQFRKFESSLKDSKSFHLEFTSKVVREKEGWDLSGSVTLARGDKACIKASGTRDGKEFSVQIVSDGNVLQVTSTQRGNIGRMATPDRMNEGFLTRFARISAGRAVLDLHDALLRLDEGRAGARSPSPELANTLPTVGHLKSSPAEVSGKETLDQIQFTVAEGSGERTEIALWLNRKDLSPAKRRMEPTKAGGGKGTESYERAVLNEPPAVDAFKLGK
jgi:hypothetical protein